MKVLFRGLIVAGFAGCTVFGIGPVLKRMGGNWLSGPMLAGTVLGVAILVLAVMFATGVRPALLPRDLDMAYALAVTWRCSSAIMGLHAADRPRSAP
ncbi:MAG: hypothetical protein ACYC77_11115 [Coriobacteriia bacterium]